MVVTTAIDPHTTAAAPTDFVVLRIPTVRPLYQRSSREQDEESDAQIPHIGRRGVIPALG